MGIDKIKEKEHDLQIDILKLSTEDDLKPPGTLVN